MTNLDNVLGASSVKVDRRAQRFIEFDSGGRVKDNGHILRQHVQIALGNAQTRKGDVTSNGNDLGQLVWIILSYSIECLYRK